MTLLSKTRRAISLELKSWKTHCLLGELLDPGEDPEWAAIPALLQLVTHRPLFRFCLLPPEIG